MREIKYRAWIKDYALMADVNFLNINYKEIVVMIDENDYEFNCGEYELMQYTGLEDKNGIEIYEGDIIKYVYRKPMLPELYVVKDMTNYHDMRILEKIISKPLSVIEVIGNIYENPKLLQVD